MKSGYLDKTGKRTGRLIARFYILRDNALFVYKS